MSTRLRRGLIAALAVLTGLSLLLVGQLSSPGIGESRYERPANSCQGPASRRAENNCVERPAYDPPTKPYLDGATTVHAP